LKEYSHPQRGWVEGRDDSHALAAGRKNDGQNAARIGLADISPALLAACYVEVELHRVANQDFLRFFWKNTVGGDVPMFP